MTSNQRKLKNLLINPKFQMKYVFWVSFTGLFLIGLCTLVFYHYTTENYSLLVELSPMSEAARSQLYTELKQVLLILGLFSVFFLTLTTCIGLIFSHRAAGPLYHFKRVFSEVRAGNPRARIHLRPNDEFQDVAAEFNAMMDQMMDAKNKAGP